MYAVYFCVESNYCTKHFMGGFALQYRYANECKFGPQKYILQQQGREPVFLSTLSLNADAEFLTQSRAALAKCTALKQFIADIITFKLPPSIYNIRISQDNYWP